MMFSHFSLSVLDELSVSCSYSTITNYSSTFQSVFCYLGDDIPLDSLFTRERLVLYQSYLIGRSVCRNTIAFYMRVLRSLYYRAVRQGLVAHTDQLFSCVFTTDEPTIKRSLTVDLVRRIATADLSDHSTLMFSRDLFMLSIYLQGMPFIDLAHLRKSDLKNNRVLQYRRHKTKVEIIVGLDPRALALLDKYRHTSPDSPYLLPIINHPGDSASEIRQYHNALRNYNRHLKRLAVLLHIDEPLSSYVGRHTWATLAHHSGIGIQVISQALGHRKEETTHIYLRLLHSEVFQAANRKVIDILFGSPDAKSKPAKKIRKGVLSPSEGVLNENVHLW